MSGLSWTVEHPPGVGELPDGMGTHYPCLHACMHAHTHTDKKETGDQSLVFKAKFTMTDWFRIVWRLNYW